MKEKRAFFLIEVMVGFVLLQIVLLVAVGYVSYHMQVYEQSLERLKALQVAQAYGQAIKYNTTYTTPEGYKIEYAYLALAQYPEYSYGIVTVTYTVQNQPKEVQLPVGKRALRWV